MSNQFKPGDLAIIVGCEKRDTLIGSVVELLQRVNPGERFKTPGGSEVISVGSGPAWIVLADGIVSIDGHAGWSKVNERHLMPLRGDCQPEQQKSREVEHV